MVQHSYFGEGKRSPFHTSVGSGHNSILSSQPASDIRTAGGMQGLQLYMYLHVWWCMMHHFPYDGQYQIMLLGDIAIICRYPVLKIRETLLLECYIKTVIDY